MSCPQGHRKDPTWTYDLIWKYFHESTTKAKSLHWHKYMDPKGELDDRHRVYEMLVDEPSQTKPTSDEERSKSMLPWNQLHTGIIKAFKSKYACGGVTKTAFHKYMGWPNAYPDEIPVGKKGFDPVAFTVRNLMAGKPVLARTADTRYGWHFVGIVGARKNSDWEFLYLDPWAGNSAPITYAGARTLFLGVITQVNGKMKYGPYDVNTVSGYAP